MGAGLGSANEAYPFLNQRLTCLVRWVGLARNDDLHRAFGIGQQAKQPLRVMQQQVRSLVSREAPCKAERQRVGIKQALRRVNRLGQRAGSRQFPGQPFASVFNERLTGRGAESPETGVRNAANVLLQGLHRSQPAALSTGFRPKTVGVLRVPGWHMDPVSHVRNRNFVLRPVRKERQKEVPAHLPMQATHPIDRPTSANRKIGHVERFRRVVRVLAAEGQQFVAGYA